MPTATIQSKTEFKELEDKKIVDANKIHKQVTNFTVLRDMAKAKLIGEEEEGLTEDDFEKVIGSYNRAITEDLKEVKKIVKRQLDIKSSAVLKKQLALLEVAIVEKEHEKFLDGADAAVKFILGIKN